MTKESIEKGKLVEFTYQIVDENGDVKEQIDLPLTYIHGHDSGMYEKIEKALEGKHSNDKVIVELSPEEGFGEADPDMMFEDDIENVPPEFRMIGAEAEFQNDQGDVKTFRVAAIENGKVIMDGNHPLAGKQVAFHITVNSVRDATEDELSGKVPTGQAAGLPTDDIPPTLN
jgi:FKBP-type peptidyl-prolyl cis-trans isomerase SlyD